jgi:hypothetical protein
VLTSGNAGRFRVWGRLNGRFLVVLALGIALDGRMPDGERFPGQPFGFWTRPVPMSMSVCGTRCDVGPVLLWPLKHWDATAWSGAEEGEDGQHPAVLVGRLR